MDIYIYSKTYLLHEYNYTNYEGGCHWVREDWAWRMQGSLLPSDARAEASGKPDFAIVAIIMLYSTIDAPIMSIATRDKSPLEATQGRHQGQTTTQRL